ncbi:MAG TPA: 16S rRNA methyltransferase [Blastocatellia bacterium]|nr:16S rRNA methyltransferase [Blastocatellia bacterium]
MNKCEDQIARLVEAVSKSAKYRRVSPAFIEAVGARELARQPRLKEAVKATKNKLHQVGGAFLDYKPDYAKWLDGLKRAALSEDPYELRRACADIMAHHASTRERLPVLDRFYKDTLAHLPPISSVIDVACGLNPLSIPWMPLAESSEYYAVDIYEDLVEFLNGSFDLLGVRGWAEARDVSQASGFARADLALVLKAIPCLEQVDKSAGPRLLDVIEANHILVSFPARTLCGRSKGMAASYEVRFRQMMEGRRGQVRRFEFDTELAFLISR